MKTLICSTLVLIGLFLPGVIDGPMASKAHADEKISGTLSPDKLKEMLDDLGYEPKSITRQNGTKYYHLSISRDGWDFHVAAEMSSDRTVLWLSTRLCKLADPSMVKAEVLEKILKFNADTTPNRFVVRKDRWLTFDLPMPVAGLTPSELRQDIDTYLTIIKHTHTTWRDVAESKPMPVATK